MRRLDRNAVAEPTCLASYQHGANSWSDVTAVHRAQIRAQLEQLQGRRCAYCEGSLDALGYHIEHFRRKDGAHFPHLTFVWANLYWSCDQADSCGRYKDHGAGAHNPDDLVDPCLEDPDQFFRFRSDGTISLRPGLSGADMRRAEESLRVFNLNPRWGRLRNMRKAAVSPYLTLVDGCVEFSVAELQDFLKEELDLAGTLPFSTAIRHVLTEP
jgi:uncharacterized protein (TIGR02646 family)